MMILNNASHFGQLTDPSDNSFTLLIRSLHRLRAHEDGQGDVERGLAAFFL